MSFNIIIPNVGNDPRVQEFKQDLEGCSDEKIITAYEAENEMEEKREREEKERKRKELEQQLRMDLLMDVLSWRSMEYIIGYKKIKELVEDYYAERWREVELRISYMMDNDDGIYHWSNIFITLIEKTSFMGHTTLGKTNIGVDGLKKIVASILESQGKELISFKSNATTTYDIVGYGMGEHMEKTMKWKSFTIIAREKRN